MAVKPSKALAIALLAAVAVALALPYARTIGIDDAFITYRYALNLAQHGQLVYNLDGDRSFAATAPGYAVLLAGCKVLGLDIPAAGTWLGVASIFIAALALLDLLGGLSEPAASFGAMLLALAPPLWLVLGMEGLPALALALLGWACARRGRQGWASVAFVAATLLRFDAAAAAAAWGLSLAVNAPWKARKDGLPGPNLPGVAAGGSRRPLPAACLAFRPGALLQRGLAVLSAALSARPWRRLGPVAFYAVSVAMGYGTLFALLGLQMPSTLAAKQAQNTLGIGGFFPGTTYAGGLLILGRAYWDQAPWYAAIVLLVLAGLAATAVASYRQVRRAARPGSAGTGASGAARGRDRLESAELTGSERDAAGLQASARTPGLEAARAQAGLAPVPVGAAGPAGRRLPPEGAAPPGSPGDPGEATAAPAGARGACRSRASRQPGRPFALPACAPAGWLLGWLALHIGLYLILGVSPYIWYYLPAVPALAALAATGTAALAGRLGRPRPSAKWAALAALAALALAAPLTSHLIVTGHLPAWAAHPFGGGLAPQGASASGQFDVASKVRPEAKVRPYRAAGAWLAENTPPGATVGASEVGIIGYFSQRPMVDFLGLLDNDVARALARRDPGWALYARQPDYLVLSDVNPIFGFDIYRDPWFQAAYAPRASVPGQGFWGGDLTIYQRTVPMSPVQGLVAGMPASAQPLQVTFGGVLELDGLEAARSPWQAGGATGITLYWRVLARPPKNYTVFVHAWDALGHLIATHDGPPMLGAIPTSELQPGQMLADFQPLAMPPLPLAPTALQIGVGVYDAATGQRLPASSPSNPAFAYDEALVSGRILLPAAQPAVLGQPGQGGDPAGGISITGYALDQPAAADTSSGASQDGFDLTLQVGRCDQPAQLEVQVWDSYRQAVTWQDTLKVTGPGAWHVTVKLAPAAAMDRPELRLRATRAAARRCIGWTPPGTPSKITCRSPRCGRSSFRGREGRPSTLNQHKTMILAFKLIFTPLFIGSITLAGRRWGPAVSGLLTGLPLTSAPVSLFLVWQYGRAFAGRAAVGTLAGTSSMCLFCLAYSATAGRCRWPLSALAGVCAFLLATALWNCFSWSLAPAFGLLLLVIGLTSRLIPRAPVAPHTAGTPKWDLPARMTLAAAFVVGLTGFASALGPQLSGLLSPFPVFTLVLSVFTHQQEGAAAVRNLLRGIVLGVLAAAGFFLVVGLALMALPLAWTYALAAAAALSMSGLASLLIARGEGQTSERPALPRYRPDR